MPFSSTLTSLATKAVAKFIGCPAVLVILKNPAEAIPIQFNPSEYKITEGTKYSQRERLRRDEPVVSFAGNPMAKLELKLYFDNDEIYSMISMGVAGATAAMNLINGTESEDKDIKKTIDKITALTKIDGEEHAPPNLAFVWGSMQFVGNVSDVVTTYTMFDKSGKALRAVVSLTMVGGYNNSGGERQSPLMSPDRTKARIMTEDSNIWNIAEREYGDTREWRRIADANNIMNPLDVPVGTVLKVPSIND